MPRILFALLFTAVSFAQTNVRGSVEGTNEYQTSVPRETPKIAWEMKPRYRDSGGMALIGNVLVTGNINGRGGIYAYDAATGKSLWTLPGMMRGAPGADATAAYAVTKTTGAAYRLNKIDAKSGKVLWFVDEEELGNDEDAAPLIGNGLVFMANRNDSLLALDAATGKPVWRHDKTRICSPLLSIAGDTLYFSGKLADGKGNMAALDARTGKVHWTANLPNEKQLGCSEPTAFTDGLLVTRTGEILLGVDAATGTVRWNRPVRHMWEGRDRAAYLSEPVVTGGVAYVPTATGIFGFQVSNGQPVFEFPATLKRDKDSTLMAAADGVLLFPGNNELPREQGNASGWLYALDLKTKQILWKHQVARPGQYDKNGTWGTRHFLPAGGALYYENNQLLVKLAP